LTVGGAASRGAANPGAAIPSIAIVMPAYNEAGRITGTFEAIAAYLARTGAALPLFLADDGSTDRTTGTAWAVASRLGLPLTILRMPHRGKAFTVRDAMIAVSGRTDVDLLMLLDADNEISIDQLDRAAWSSDPRTLYIGRRVGEVDGSIAATPPPFRRLMSTAMRLAARWLLGLRYPDTQCGFKLFPRALAFELFSQQQSAGWVFDAEILVIAQRSEMPIVEIPVTWQPRGVSRVSTGAAVTSAIALAGIAVRRWGGRYKRVGPPIKR